MRRVVCAVVCAFLLQGVGAMAAPVEEVVVTASKTGEAAAQDLPMAVNVFGTSALRARQVESLRDLSFAMPNVQLEDIGTARGIANFSIRGVGVNSSIASVDPAVGLFVDGVYVGINAGALGDLVDVEAVEVLRGPQGTLYGHNVTGGVVVLRTRLPGDDCEVQGRVAIEAGPKAIGAAVVSGPLLPGILSARLAVQGSHDDGWLHNGYTHQPFGKDASRTARLSLRFTPGPAFEAILRAEDGRETGDGPAGQNHALFSRSSFAFAIDNPGYAKTKWRQLSLETHWHVPFGDGTVTNIAGMRAVEVGWGADIDSTPAFVFHTRVLNVQRQRSEEVRFAGRFGAVETVAGLYYFDQHLLYIDERNFSPSFRRTGGGSGYFRSQAAFANADWRIDDTLTVSAGVRFTHESKNARISRVRRAEDDLDGAASVPGEGMAGGDLDARTLTPSDSPVFQRWDDLSSRLALQWWPTTEDQLYASWSRAFRGGGANFRTSSLSIAPLSYDPERQMSFEIGWKRQFAGGHLNTALFHTRIADMQRETNLADPVSGVQQLVLNAGDATLYGGEIELDWQWTESLVLSLQAGYVHGGYSRVSADLNGDLVVDAADARLRIPRLAPLSYGIGLAYALPLRHGDVTARIGLQHRDGAFYNDSNLGRLNAMDSLDAQLAYAPALGNWRIAVYGRNLLGIASFGGDTTLPASAAFGYDGGARPTFSPLNKGRVIGIALSARG